jgi:hypothetical protein
MAMPETPTSRIVVTETGRECVVSVQHSDGGGDATLMMRDEVVERVVRVLERMKQRNIPFELVAPAWVREELRSRGYEL